MDKDKVKIGKIIGVFGIKGECKIYPFTNDLNIFLFFKFIYIKNNNIFKKMEIEKLRIHKNIIIIKFYLLNYIEESEKLKNFSIYIEKKILLLENKDENKNYYFQLKGCKVILKNKKILGILSDIIKTKAHFIYVVKTIKNKEILIPVVKNIVLEEDIEKKMIIIDLIPGLVDDEYED